MPRIILLALAVLLCAAPAGAQAPAEGAPPAQTGEPPRAEPPPPTGTIDLSAVPDEGPVMTLPEMLRLAETRSYDLAVARERIAQADASVRRAWAGVTPDAAVVGTYTRNAEKVDIQLGPGQEIPFQKFNQFGAIFTVRQPIFVMPVFLAIESAKLAVEATQASVRNIRNEVLFGIAQTYYGALAAKRFIALSQSQLEATEEQERVAKARFEVGQSPKVEYLRAGVARAQAEQDLLRARNQYVTAKLALQALVGVELPFQVAPPPPVELPSLDADDAVSVALAERGDLVAQRKLEEVAGRSVTAAWWQFAPVLSAEGDYRWSNASGFTGQEWTWLIQVTAAWTIYDGGRYADLDATRSQLRAAYAQKESLARTVVQQVRTALLALESARANLKKAQEQRRLALESAELVRAQYQAGVATYLDILDANNSLFAAGLSVVLEESNVEVAALQLRKSIGRFALGATEAG